jgi:hypothetical protein
MPRGTLVVDAKLLKDHYLRQQRVGNVAGYRGARMGDRHVSEVFSRYRSIQTCYPSIQTRC